MTKNFEVQQAFYAHYSDEYDERVVKSPYYEVLNRQSFDVWVRKYLRADDVVLDIGCGSGHQTLPLLSRGLRAVSIDASEEMLRLAQQKVDAADQSERADFIRASAENLPFRAGVFDAFVSYGTLHHLDDPYLALTNANTSLRAGGRYYILDLNASPIRFLFELLMRAWRLWEEEAHDDALFRASQLRSWLASTSSECNVQLSTFLPPHTWYVIRGLPGRWLLRLSDAAFGSIPLVRDCAGILIVSGTKSASRLHPPV